MQLPLALADVWAAADSVSGWATSTQQCAADLAAGVKPAHLLAGVVVAVFLSPLLLNLSAWLLWILLSIVLGLSRILYSIFTVLHVVMDVWALSAMKTCYTIYRFLQTCLMPTAAASTRHRLLSSRNLAEYQALARQVDTEDGLVAWREDDETDLPQAEMLKSTIAKLDESMRARDANKLQFMLLNGLLKRNHLGIDERALHLRALSGTKLLVEQYDKKVVECIQFLCDCHELTREEKTIFFKKARRALGQTALLLSGGGSIAMYHAGVVRALITEGLYKHVRVISGASGGSIIAGQLAMHSEKELMEKVLVKEVSTDFKGTGEMKRRNIVWFPPLIAQAKHFLRNGVLIDNKEFQKTCEFYYGDTTFQEGFERTRKHVCISVAASTLGSANPGGPRRLLLNHVTTPNVLIRSAVAASCSLPGIMLPNFLLCKNETGQIVPFEMDGVQYVDGSLQADLPFRRISTLFAVSHFIVSQVNFHIVPFIHKAHSPSENSLYWKLFRFFDTDIRHRVTSLAELGLLPRVFGQDLSGIFKQKYSGHVTLTPKFRMSEMVGLKAFQNPTESEMQHYILNGKRSVWPHIHHIKHNTLVERTLAEGLAKLRRQSYLSAMGQPGTGSVTSSPSRPLPTPLQYAVPSGMATNGGTGTHANGASSPSATPTTTPRGLHSSLPPLAPTNGSSAASSRSSTPRRVVREDISMPPPLSLATLRRSDSGRFEDDDGDMLEGGANTPSSMSMAASLDGNAPEGAANNQRFVRPHNHQQHNNLSKVRQLQAENTALREQVARLQKTLGDLLAKTELGVFQHHESTFSEEDSVRSLLLAPGASTFMARGSSLASSSLSEEEAPLEEEEPMAETEVVG